MTSRASRAGTRDHSLAPSYAEPAAAARAALEAKASAFLAASNDRKSPQWMRKSYAHAYAGVVNAIHIFEAHFPAQQAEASPQPTGDCTGGRTGADLSPGRPQNQTHDLYPRGK